MTQQQIKEFSKYSIRNMEYLKTETKAGCYFCGSIFSPEKITDWVEEYDGKETALCPYCIVDSVIGEKTCGFEITQTLLAEVCRFMFAGRDCYGEDRISKNYFFK